MFTGAFTARFNNGSVDYATHGYGRGSSYSVGGGYGGNAAGGSNNSTGGSYGGAYAPLLPGSPAGLYNANFPYGGGTVCVLASGAVTVEGTVRALGKRNSQHSSCSGGAIWLAGSSVTVEDAATVSADGEINDSHVAYAAGGGGRIAFAIGVDTAKLDALADGDDPAALDLEATDIVSARVTAAGGVNTQGGASGKAGTKKQVFDPNAFTTLTVTADPVEYAADNVVYGSDSVAYGNSKTLTAPDWSYNTTERTDSRYAFAGYVVSNKNEQVGQGGAADKTATVSFVKPLGAYELRWKWGARETHHTVTVSDGTMGTLTVNGAAYEPGTVYWSPEARTDELVATPAADCTFLYWTGDVSVEACRSATLRLSAEKAYKVRAVFRRETAEPTTYHWKKNASGYWDDQANWVEGNIPGAKDDVVIGAGTCTARNLFEVNSLTLTNAASLAVSGCREVKVATDLRMRNSAALRIVARETDATHTWATGATAVRIGGLFSLTNAATLYPECDKTTGGAPVIFCRRFDLATGAKVDAKALGFGATNVVQVSGIGWHPVNLCPNGGNGTAWTVGGGYGGLGGSGAVVGQRGSTFGLALSPIHPGASTGAYDANNNKSGALGNVRRGGGLVRIHADRMHVGGTIDASGYGVNYGGSSGGGIWLTSFAPKSLSFGPSAQLLAPGGYSNYENPNPSSQGGGGRIAIGLCLSQETMAEMVATGAYPGKAAKHVFGLDTFTNRYGAVTVNLCPGRSPSAAVWSTAAKYQGTFNFVDGTQPGLSVIVR